VGSVQEFHLSPITLAAATGGAPTLPIVRALPQSPRSVFQNLRAHWTPPNRTPERKGAFTQSDSYVYPSKTEKEIFKIGNPYSHQFNP
jgi:hypothetical protein